MKYIVEVVRYDVPGQPRAFYGPFDNTYEATEFGNKFARDDVVVAWRHLNTPTKES